MIYPFHPFIIIFVGLSNIKLLLKFKNIIPLKKNILKEQMQVSIKNLSKIVSGDFNDPFVDDTIIVKDGLIKEIGDVSEKKIKESNVIINANGSIAIPGLIDSHVHITFGDYT